VTFREVAGVTALDIPMRLPSQEIRDMVVASGMEEGTQVSDDRLEDLLASGAGS
jgi:hypothetical protein